MTDEKALTPMEQKSILFYDDELTAVKLESGKIFVPVRRLCDNLGLDWSAQRRRINRNEVLSGAIRSVAVTTTDLASKFAPGRSEMLCLPLDLIPGWLFGVPAGRVRDQIRPKLLRYQRECFKVLWNAFKADILPTMDPSLAPPAAEMTPAERALTLAEAVYNMAQQQVAMERWLAHHDGRLDLIEDEVSAAHDRLDRAAEVVSKTIGRVGALELRVFGPYQVISEAQAAELAALVKAIAHTLTEQDPGGGNYYQSVWGELYRRYGVTTYRRVPAAKFGDVTTWLENWLGSLDKGENTVPVDTPH